MRNPNCPNCKNSFTLLDGLRMFNPWKVKCRKCGAILEAGRWQKAGLFAGFALGIAVGGVARWQEKAGNWETSESLIFFAFSLAVVFLVGLPFWPRCTFRIKRNA